MYKIVILNNFDRCFFRCVRSILALSYVSVRSSIRMVHHDFHRPDFHEISYLRFLLKFVVLFSFVIKLDENNTVDMNTNLCL
jgi:hypothetical protein